MYAKKLYGIESRLVSCLQCDHVYFKRQPTKTSLQKYYDSQDGYLKIIKENVTNSPTPIDEIKISPSLSPPKNGKFRHLPSNLTTPEKPIADQYRIFDEFINESMNKKLKDYHKVLEIGTSYGQFLHALIKEGHEAHGIEISETSSRVPKELGYEIFTLDVEEQIPKNNYDVVLAIEVLEHLSKPSKFFKNVHDSMSESGIILGMIPNINSYSASVERENWYWNGFPDHIHFFTEKSLMRYAQTFGFSVKGITSWIGHGSLEKEWECIKERFGLQDDQITKKLNELYENKLGPELMFIMEKSEKS